MNVVIEDETKKNNKLNHHKNKNYFQNRIKNIINKKERTNNQQNKKGKINSREEIRKEKLLTDKTYKQAIGFLRINDGNNILDETAVHPESYDVALNLLKEIDMNINDIGTDKLIKKLKEINLEEYVQKLNTDIYTLTDISESLQKPHRDPRDDMPKPILKSDVLNIDDLKVGMKLQ